jgi:hypothetical protein
MDRAHVVAVIVGSTATDAVLVALVEQTIFLLSLLILRVAWAVVARDGDVVKASWDRAIEGVVRHAGVGVFGVLQAAMPAACGETFVEGSTLDVADVHSWPWVDFLGVVHQFLHLLSCQF